MGLPSLTPKAERPSAAGSLGPLKALRRALTSYSIRVTGVAEDTERSVSRSPSKTAMRLVWSMR